MSVTVALSSDADPAHSAPLGQGSPMDSNSTEWRLGEYTRYYRELLGFLTVTVYLNLNREIFRPTVAVMATLAPTPGRSGAKSWRDRGWHLCRRPAKERGCLPCGTKDHTGVAIPSI